LDITTRSCRNYMCFSRLLDGAAEKFSVSVEELTRRITLEAARMLARVKPDDTAFWEQFQAALATEPKVNSTVVEGFSRPRECRPALPRRSPAALVRPSIASAAFKTRAIPGRRSSWKTYQILLVDAVKFAQKAVDDHDLGAMEDAFIRLFKVTVNGAKDRKLS